MKPIVIFMIIFMANSCMDAVEICLIKKRESVETVIATVDMRPGQSFVWNNDKYTKVSILCSD